MKQLRLPLSAVIATGLLTGSMVAVAAQSDDAQDGASLTLITEVVRPGVELVLGDEAGHDLTVRHPQYRRDMDLIAIGPGGTVWIASSARLEDNEFLEGMEVWALGRPGITSIEAEDLNALLVQPDGTPIAVVASGVFVLDDDEWIASPGSREWTTDAGTVRLIEPDDPVPDDLDLGYLGLGVLAVLWDGEAWTTSDQWGETIDDPDAGQWRIDPDGGIDGRVDGVGFGLLEGTDINMIALAPDGSIWAIGGIGDENGGVYRIDPQLASEPAPDDGDTSIA